MASRREYCAIVFSHVERRRLAEGEIFLDDDDEIFLEFTNPLERALVVIPGSRNPTPPILWLERSVTDRPVIRQITQGDMRSVESRIRFHTAPETADLLEDRSDLFFGEPFLPHGFFS